MIENDDLMILYACRCILFEFRVQCVCICSRMYEGDERQSGAPLTKKKTKGKKEEQSAYSKESLFE